MGEHVSDKWLETVANSNNPLPYAGMLRPLAAELIQWRAAEKARAMPGLPSLDEMAHNLAMAAFDNSNMYTDHVAQVKDAIKLIVAPLYARLEKDAQNAE